MAARRAQPSRLLGPDGRPLALTGGYSGASRQRPALRHFTPPAADADSDTVGDLDTLRARSRDLVRNAPLAGGAINTLVTNVVGTGLTLQARVDAELLGLDEDAAAAWQRAAEREWLLWSESTLCDVTRGQDFYGLQALAFRSALESGDVFAVLPSLETPGWPYRLAVQLIEADRCCNPNWRADTDTLVSGVEMDAWGAPVRYHFASRHPGARRGKGISWAPVEAVGAATGRRNVLHLFSRRRPGQTRGVPVLAGVIEPIKQLGRYTEAELQAAVVSGAFAVFVTMDAAAFGDLFGDDTLRDQYLAPSTRWDGSVGSASMDGPGRAVNLMPGEKVEQVNPGRPNDKFEPFFDAIAAQVGMELEIPREVLLKVFNSSYSAARAALLDAWRFFRGRRDWLSGAFCQPIYETFLAESIAAGRLAAPGFFADPAIRRAWCGSVWVGDGPGSIDPQKEISAAADRVALGVSTRAAESVLYDGGDWEAKTRQLAREAKLRRELGLEGASGPPAPPPAP